jgi:hypothetical protein
MRDNIADSDISSYIYREREREREREGGREGGREGAQACVCAEVHGYACTLYVCLRVGVVHTCTLYGFNLNILDTRANDFTFTEKIIDY